MKNRKPKKVSQREMNRILRQREADRGESVRFGGNGRIKVKPDKPKA